MVGIKEDKYCCGNCGEWDAGLCYGDTIYPYPCEPTKGACGMINDNFIDRGYTFKFQKIDFFPPRDTSLRSKDG